MKAWIILLVGVLAASGARAEPKRTSDVLQDCSITAPDASTFLACMSYVQGLMDGFYRVDQSLVEITNKREGYLGLCLPVNGVRGDVLVQHLKSHVEAVPKDEGLLARTVIFTVLKEMYPCKKVSVPDALHP